jgi:alkylation response protein AidB-like acyl-CoA dehydrogenase
MPLSAVHALVDTAETDLGVWTAMTTELGLAGIAIPEQYGGAGAGYRDLAVAIYELGAGLVPSPLMASAVLAAGLLQHLDESACKEYLPAIATGELLATVCLEPDSITASASAGGGITVTGVGPRVLYGAQAQVIFVAAQHDQTKIICAVPTDSPGLLCQPLTSIDPRLVSARVEFNSVAALTLAEDAASALRVVSALANLALAAEQSGAMDACIRMTSAYAKDRVAFGQPIGAYQAVKHRLADMYTAWSLGLASVREAARCADEDPPALAVAALAARSLVSPAYFEAAGNVVQLYGGIGYTWEHDAHLYYKHALAGQAIFGGPSEQLDRLAEALSINGV